MATPEAGGALGSPPRHHASGGVEPVPTTRSVGVAVGGAVSARGVLTSGAFGPTLPGVSDRDEEAAVGAR